MQSRCRLQFRPVEPSTHTICMGGHPPEVLSCFRRMAAQTCLCRLSMLLGCMLDCTMCMASCACRDQVAPSMVPRYLGKWVGFLSAAGRPRSACPGKVCATLPISPSVYAKLSYVSQSKSTGRTGVFGIAATAGLSFTYPSVNAGLSQQRPSLSWWAEEVVSSCGRRCRPRLSS